MELRTQYLYKFKNGNTGFGKTREEAVAEAIDSYRYSKDRRFQKVEINSQAVKTDGFYMTFYEINSCFSFNAREKLINQLRAFVGVEG